MDKGTVPVSTLRRCPLLKGVGDRELLALGGALRAHRLRPGQELFRQGEPGDSLIIVTEGRVALQIEQAGGDALLSEIGPGEVLGEVACIDPSPRAATARAQGEAAIVTLDRAGLVALRDSAPEAAVALLGAITGQLTARLRDTNRYIEEALPGRARGPASVVIPAMPLPAAPPPKPTPYRWPVDLSNLPSLEGLTPRDLELLISVAPPMLYPDGTNLCAEGASASSCFLVAQGEVLVLKMVGTQLRQLATLGPGSFVGQLALVDRAPRSATVRAQGDAVVLTLGREDFERLLAARSPLAMRFQEQIALAGIRQLRMAAARLFAILHRGPAAASSPFALSSMRPAGGSGPLRVGPVGNLSRPDVDAALGHVRSAIAEWDLTLPDLERAGEVEA